MSEMAEEAWMYVQWFKDIMNLVSNEYDQIWYSWLQEIPVDHTQLYFTNLLVEAT